jgi:hypothetical protein
MRLPEGVARLTKMSVSVVRVVSDEDDDSDRRQDERVFRHRLALAETVAEFARLQLRADMSNLVCVAVILNFRDLPHNGFVGMQKVATN